ncbi:MAG: phosphoglycerate dehydrogenase [Oscillospiraceae bacterium]|nr:phosphoglycerate dehydrogenase [Oscillospiraceae bacterium]
MYKFVSFFGDRSPLFEELNEKARAYARTKGIDFVWVPQKPYDVEDVIAQLNDTDAAMIDVEPYDENIFGRMNDRCKLLVRFGVGFDKVNLPDATAHGLAIARTTGANKTGVAEMALMQMLAAGRQVMLNRKTVASGVWEKNIGTELIGKKVGILGFGNIGITLARLLQGFDCELVAYDTCPNEAAASALGVRFTDLEEIITTCDAISIHLPYNAETHHLFDAAVFDRMKSSAILVCTARGNIIDEDALYSALKEGRIAGAGLDVYAQEPLGADSPLIGLDNIVLTPHVASQTHESLWNTYKKGVDIVADFFAGSALERGDLLNPEYAGNPRQ